MKTVGINSKRLIPFSLFVCIFGFIIIGRLFQIQVLLHKSYKEKAAIQHQNRVEIKLPRGRIFDRRGKVLSLNIPRSYSYGVHPDQVDNPRETAQQLANISNRPYNYYYSKICSESNFVFLARQLDMHSARNYRSVPGLVEKSEIRRYYPFGMRTPKAVGFTDRDCKGLAGLELMYDSTLTSVSGWEIILEDALGNEAKNSATPLVDPVPGSDMVLTFDNIIQNIVVDELQNAVNHWQAKGGFAIVLLPRTGEILGMHSEPSINPNNAGSYDFHSRRIRSVVDMYEPGSTFKIIPVLAALRKGISTSERFYCENGKYRIGDHWIKDVHPYKYMSLEEILIYSSNIGIAKVSAKVGSQLLYKTARDLGFGTLTGIKLPGEARGMMKSPRNWDKYLLATFGIGQGISCTGIQLCEAFSVLAADGLLMKPRLVRAILGPHGSNYYSSPKALRRAATYKETKILTDILVKAVEEGTGKAARIEGVKIAGKTGTAQVFIEEEDAYSTEKYISSFIGFTVDEPRILCLVVIEEPKYEIYGGTVAAPYFKNIVEQVIPIVAMEQKDKYGPDIVSKVLRNDLVTVPQLVNLERDKAVSLLNKRNLIPQFINEGDRIVEQFPLPDREISAEDTVWLRLVKIPQKKTEIVGMPMRDAVKALVASGYEVSIKGSGRVIKASFSGMKCKIQCKLPDSNNSEQLTSCVFRKY